MVEFRREVVFFFMFSAIPIENIKHFEIRNSWSAPEGAPAKQEWWNSGGSCLFLCFQQFQLKILSICKIKQKLMCAQGVRNNSLSGDNFALGGNDNFLSLG